MTETGLPAFADVEAAAARIAPWAVRTPVVENADLNARAGARVLLKLETVQRTGSFKFRGACNVVAQIADADRAKGVVAFSSGNHGQGVAAAAALFGIAATIVMPADAPAAKLDGARALGAETVFYDRAKDDREAMAEAVTERGATLIRPFDDAKIVAGQGTAGLEFARAAAARGVRLEDVLVPCSGGGLVAGTALAFGHESPATRVWSVEAEGFDGMARSLAAGRRVAAPGGPASLADALMAPLPGAVPFAVAWNRLAGGLAVNEAELAAAVCYAARTLKLVVEPSGAAGLAALLAGRISPKDAAGVVMSGGNCDPELLAACCARAAGP